MCNNYVTFYVRKIDKKGIKIQLQNSCMTFKVLYDLLLSNNDFLKFVQADFENKYSNYQSSLNQWSEEILRRSIELYYLGNLIDKSDQINKLKLKDMSIVHVIIRESQTQKKSAKINQEKQGLLKAVKQQTKDSDQNLLNEKNNQIRRNLNQPNSNYHISLKILFSKNISITDQQNFPLVISHELQQINQNIDLIISDLQLKNQLIKQSLARFHFLNKIEQKILSINLAKDKNLNIIGLSRCKMKLVHMGRGVEVELQNNQKADQEVKSSSPKWAYLNLHDKSQLIVMVTAMTVKTEQVLKIQKLPNLTKSLFLQLQHILTLRLYEQYKIWDREWSSSFNKCKTFSGLENSVPNQNNNLSSNNQNDAIDESDLIKKINQQQKQIAKNEQNRVRSFHQQNELTSSYSQHHMNNKNETEIISEQRKKCAILIF